MKEKEEYNFTKAKQGAVADLTSNKKRITIRLDESIIEWFRKKVHDAGGGNYQTLINEALKEYISSFEGTFENTLRKVLKEEINPKFSNLDEFLKALSNDQEALSTIKKNVFLKLSRKKP
ncbi:MAG: BrnA antitoxin family protein [Ignavibacteria bacterium]|nr:BrnA antitoxin family protein [Ignavibacteria bacterium]